MIKRIDKTNDILLNYTEKFEKLDGEKTNAYELLKDGLPRFYSENKILEEIYYFRAYTLCKHIKKEKSGKYILTEWNDTVSYAPETDGAISCAVGHHLAELKWIPTLDFVAKDYIDFWLENSDALFHYGNWFFYAVYEYCEYTGNMSFAYERIEKLIELFNKKEQTSKANCGLYKSVDNLEGMELGISSYGVRPTVNSYIYGDAYGIYKILERFGDSRAAYYKDFCKRLKARINAELFKNDFYYALPLEKGESINFNPHFSNPTPKYFVKELIGYVPFYFNVAEKEQMRALSFLTDKDVFSAEYGLRTADKSDPLFGFPFPHVCLWNGPVWPYATSQTLRGVANAVRTGNAPIGKKEYSEMLLTYASSQYILLDGVKRPWIDESLDGETGEWLTRKLQFFYNNADKERGKDYNHSAFIDHVLCDLCGFTVVDGKTEIKPVYDVKTVGKSRVENVFVNGKIYETELN